MKKKDLFFVGYLYTFISILLMLEQPMAAQVPTVDKWTTFVYGNLNKSVRDTFRMQTFNSLSSDNWEYTTSGNTELFDATTVGFHVNQDNLSLKLTGGSSLHFSDISFDRYTEVKAYGIYAVYNLAQGENLFISAKRTENPVNNYEWLIPQDNYSADFKDGKEDTRGHFSYLAVDKPLNLTFSIGTANTSYKGFYAFDSVYITGNIPEYSLFTGNNSWHNESNWSHLPALRHRSALINGKVTLDEDLTCKEIHIADGSILIPQNVSLTTSQIHLYFSYNSLINYLYAYKNLRSDENSYSFLINKGELNLSGSITADLTYPEKGKWYFISLPFDVYAEGIDPAFQFRDDTEKGSGNYFYLQQYNGDKRATRQTATGNWELIPIATLSTNRPLFEKNKGYLIAIDKNASSQTLRFASRPGDIPSDFGRNGTIPVQVSATIADPSNTHSGWYLCGNPFPSPLPLSAIASNPDLNGFIYIYDGNGYKAHSLNSNEALPPFSAFFVKTQKSTALELSMDHSLSTSHAIISTSAPFTNQQVEPLTTKESTTSLSIIQTKPISYIIHNELHLVDMPINGQIVITNSAGKTVDIQSYFAGNSVVHLPNQSGLYIIRIESSQYKKYHKYLYIP